MDYIEKTVKKNYIYRGKILSLRKDDALLPDGTPCVREIVEHNPDPAMTEAEVRSILIGGAKREKMRCDFDELRTIIGDKGASDRFAIDMVKRLKAATKN